MRNFRCTGPSDPRLAAYARSPPARMVVDGRRQANPVGQSGRRPDVWRGRCRSACRKNLRPGRSAPAADRAARKPIAGKRRHPAGAIAGLWRGARQACDLRLLAVRFSRWQSRRPDRGRQHRTDRAAARRGLQPKRDAASRRNVEAPLEPVPEPVSPPSAPFVAQATAAPQSAADDRAPAPSGKAPAGFALFDAFDEPPAAEEPPGLDLESVLETTSARRSHAASAPRPKRSPWKRTRTIRLPVIETAPTRCSGCAPVPLRFTWQMDRDGRFTPGTGEFTRLVGPRTTAAFGRPWSEIAATFGLDPEGRVMQAVATRATWSGITLSWPVDGGGRLPVELSGVPFFDAARNFVGYRGFGVCRDFDALARLAARRRAEPSGETADAARNVRLRHLPSRPALHRLHPTNCLNRLPPKLPLQRLLLQRLHIKQIWKRPWNLPRKPQRKAFRKPSTKVRNARIKESSRTR